MLLGRDRLTAKENDVVLGEGTSDVVDGRVGQRLVDLNTVDHGADGGRQAGHG
jgi:hypothetical protein